MSRGLALTAALALLGTAAHADVDYFKQAAKPNQVNVLEGGERTHDQKLLLGGLAAGTVLALGVGAYFNWQSHDASDQVSAHRFTGMTWTADQQAIYDRAHSDGVKAIIGYGVAGACAVALVVAIVKTDPGEHLVDLDAGRPTAIIAPTPGGAIVGATWGF